MRHYLKCKDCKKPFALETDKKVKQSINPAYVSNPDKIDQWDRDGGWLITRDMVCPFCASKKINLMGEVKKHRVFNRTFEVPCDGRCTNAQGPSCDCPCGGENHGSQKVVEVSRVVCADKSTVTIKA
jgi:hypothetical protein